MYFALSLKMCRVSKKLKRDFKVKLLLFDLVLFYGNNFAETGTVIAFTGHRSEARIQDGLPVVWRIARGLRTDLTPE